MASSKLIGERGRNSYSNSYATICNENSQTETPQDGKLLQLGLLELEMVRDTPFEALNNRVIHHYQLPWIPQIVGTHLKYMACIDEI